MMNESRKVFPFQKSTWDNGNSLISVSPSSVDLKGRTSLTVSSEQGFSSEKASPLIEQSRPTEHELEASTEGCLGCSTWPKTFAFVIGLGLICAIAVLVPIILTNIFGSGKGNTVTTITTVTTTTTATSSTTSTSATTSTSTSSTTTSSTTTPLCSAGCANTSTSTSSRLAFYSFDSNTNDATGVYSASGIASPTYTTGYVVTAIYFDASLSQRLSAPPMSLNSRSFTIEFWFSLTNAASNNYAFFGQLSVPSTGEECLFLVSAAGKLDMGFFNDDTISSTVLSSNTWYHAAFVYDINVRQRSIYINGILDIQSATGAGPYFGTSGAVTIGGADIYGSLGVPYLTGLMDHLTVSTRVKEACEILNDATLAAYFPFDGSYTDAGPNFLTVTTSGASFTSGFVNQAVSLSGSNSYIQISSLTGLGRANYPFSIAFWVYPIVYGVLAHVSSASTGLGWCTPFMGFSPSGNLITQVHYTVSPSILTGPVIQLNVWTYVVLTYSPTNGHYQYVNGILSASSPSALIYSGSGLQDFLTIGNLLSGSGCFNPGIFQNPLQGMIDELRVYSRELSSTDVCLLAWP